MVSGNHSPTSAAKTNSQRAASSTGVPPRVRRSAIMIGTSPTHASPRHATGGKARATAPADATAHEIPRTSPVIPVHGASRGDGAGILVMVVSFGLALSASDLTSTTPMRMDGLLCDIL